MRAEQELNKAPMLSSPQRSKRTQIGMKIAARHFCTPDSARLYDEAMNPRRAFLKQSVLLASALGGASLARGAVAAPGERSLRLYNTHTGESLRSVFWAEGEFLPAALGDINQLLRDHRNDQIAPIDPQLLLLLDQLGARFGDSPLYHVISGYRSPASNQLLAARSNGVARHSMHMEGRAIDIRLPGQALSALHQAALAAHGGGVGYYPDSQFVHLDTGRLRRW